MSLTDPALAAPPGRTPAAGAGGATPLMRAALAVSRAGGPDSFDELARELAAILEADAAFIAVFKDGDPSQMRTLACCLDGRLLRPFEYPLQGTPCEDVTGRDFKCMRAGVARRFPPGSLFAAKGMDGYAGYPLTGSAGQPLGLIVAMTRRPLESPDLAESMLKIFAARVSGEIERAAAEDLLRRAALAVSRVASDDVFTDLVRVLCELLAVDVGFISVIEADRPHLLKTLAVYADGRIHANIEYAIEGTPCAEVLSRQYWSTTDGVCEQFPLDPDLAKLGVRGYAGHALSEGPDGTRGILSIAARRPLPNADLVEAVIKIFAVRAAAELDRGRAQAALLDSEASYRAIFEASEDCIFVHDWDTGRILDVSPAATRLYGWLPEELRDLSVAAVSEDVPPYTEREALALIQQARVREEPVRFEWHARHKDGHLLWNDVRLQRATIAGAPRILAFVRDITERIRADEALRASEEQYRAIFNASADALVLRDAQFRIVDVNATYERMSGYARAEVLGVDGVLANPPETHGTLRELHDRALAGEPVQLETRLVRRDGASCELELRAVPVRHRGEPHVLWMGRDITERKRTEEALRGSEEQYRAIFNASADALMLWNSQLKRVDVNPAHEKIFGFAREDVVGRGFEELPYPPELARPRLEMVRRALAGQPCRAELEALRKDGRRIFTELRTIPFQHRGEPHVLQIARDITERRQADEDRVRLEAQLRQAQKMEAIGQLTGGIAHDFNNILTSVVGYVVLAAERESAASDPKLSHYLHQAEQSCRRARDLIQQMLTFSRGQRGERRRVALASLVREGAQLVRPMLPASLELDVDALGAAAVEADPVQIEQVLLNLCINARDAVGGAGRIRVTVREWHADTCICASCRAPVAGRYVEMAVADNGPGIAPEMLERVFEPFYSTKEVGKGTGMGLAVVHGIVHEHGGHVCVETSPDAGTVFRVLLPVAEGEGAQAGTGARAVRGARAPALQGRVLLVDDEHAVLAFMRELLETWGLGVTPCTSPVEALEALEYGGEDIALVITDQTMPRMTGLQLAREIAARRPALPVVLYTGYAEGLPAGEVEAAGVRAVVRKPIEPAELRNAVAPLLAAATR